MSRMVSTDSFQTPARRSNSVHNSKQVMPKPAELLNNDYLDGTHKSRLDETSES